MPNQKQQIYNHTLFRRDNLHYSFIIEERLSIGKIKITILKRDANQHRVDMSEIYFGYTKFRAILGSWKANYRNKYEAKYVSGTDGKRNLWLKINNGQIGIQMFDNIITEQNPKYTGKCAFQLKSYDDAVELFNLIKTIDSWELANINKIFSGKFNRKASK